MIHNKQIGHLLDANGLLCLLLVLGSEEVLNNLDG